MYSKQLAMLGLLIVAVIATSDANSQASGQPTARVIVQLKADSPLLAVPATSAKAKLANSAKSLGARIGIELTPGAAISEQAQVVTASGISSEELASRLSQQSDVEYAVPDEVRHHLDLPNEPNDPLYRTGDPVNGPAVGQWYLRIPTSDTKSAINAESAWTITIGTPAIVVADIDTGVRYEHPDLLAVATGGNLLPGYDMITDPITANDGDGRDADASDPGDWVTQADLSNRNGPLYQCEPAPENSSWHGTQVAGLIAALTNNGIGMASVGRTVTLLPVRALGKCGGTDSDIIAGMRWAAGFSVPGVPANPNPARVINLSLGGSGSCTSAYQQAINQIVAAGVVVVASAGNSTGHAVGVPANCVGVIAVAGLRHVGTKVGFSDLGTAITISAPGGNCVNTTAGSACLYPILTTSNAGTTTPGASIYTDSLNPSLGTSFSAPLVAGAVALMLSVKPTLNVQQVTQILESTARAFPPGGDDGNGGVVPVCTAPQFTSNGTPIDQAECACTISTCGAGMLDAGSAVLAVSTGASVSSAQLEGLWWNAPAGSESGWGLNVAQQGSTLFVTWFTYDATGKALWLSMTATPTATNTYSGILYQTSGPPLGAMPFDPARVTRTPVGNATLAFADNDHGTFAYTVNGISQTKSIAREIFGDVLTCTTGLQTDLTAATTFQDLWWNAPAGSESGWGLNLVEQSNVIFATWFTYDVDGSPVWFSMTATGTAPNVYSGTLYRSSGPPFNSAPFNPAQVTLAAVGTGTLTFTDGNDASFSYVVDGVAQTKAITREVFQNPGTTCRA